VLWININNDLRVRPQVQLPIADDRGDDPFGHGFAMD
jgi:hypothetical protein